ncbi:MAG: hypothetical protein P4M05_30905 [Bradyrhizobium sp.]|nr:hypothetical protein [Bradyrhizobium sp.]
METQTAEILEVVNFIKDRMITKDDLAELRTEMHDGFASIRAEVHDIRTRMEAIEAALHGHHGFAKEIDHLIERVAAIEKHLGLEWAIGA